MTRLLPVAMLLAVGCDGPPAAAKLGPAPVLVVTLDGQPASGLSVRLHSTTASGGGVTDAAGRVSARGPDDKALPPGTYKVTVSDAGEEEANPMDVAKSRPKSRVLAVYGKPTTTPLSLTIEPDKMEYPVDVKGKA